MISKFTLLCSRYKINSPCKIKTSSNEDFCGPRRILEFSEGPYTMKLRSTLIYRIDCDDGAQHMKACPRQGREGRQEMTRNVLRNNQHDCSGVPVLYL